MKYLNVGFTGEEHQQLKAIKGNRSWHDAILEEFEGDGAAFEDKVKKWRRLAGKETTEELEAVTFMNCADELEELLE